MLTPDPREFDTFVDFFDSLYHHLKSTKKASSLRDLSKILDIKSASYLSMLLSKKRLPTQSLLLKLLKIYPLTQNQIIYAQALVHYDRAPHFKEKREIKEKLNAMKEKLNYKKDAVNFTELRLSWLHVAVLESVFLKGFKSDNLWIAKKLNAQEAEVKSCIQDLCAVEFLNYDENKQLIRNESRISFGFGHPSFRIQDFHKSMLEKAFNSVTKNEFEERILHGMTLCCDKSQLLEAQALIKEFARQFTQKIHKNGTDHLYQLNLQFFSLSELNA